MTGCQVHAARPCRAARPRQVRDRNIPEPGTACRRADQPQRAANQAPHRQHPAVSRTGHPSLAPSPRRVHLDQTPHGPAIRTLKPARVTGINPRQSRLWLSSNPEPLHCKHYRRHRAVPESARKIQVCSSIPQKLRSTELGSGDRAHKRSEFFKDIETSSHPYVAPRVQTLAFLAADGEQR